MNFDLSEDDTALQDSVSRWVQQRYPFDARRKLAASDAGWSAAHWREMAQMGWLALPFAEAQGGLGGGPLEHRIDDGRTGQGPGAGAGAADAAALRRCVEAQPRTRGCQAAEADRRPAAGRAGLGRARQPLRTRRRAMLAAAVRATATCSNGEKALVLNGAAADQLVVVARSSGGRFDTHGISLVLVDASAPGVSRTPLRLMDGQRAAHIRFDKVAVPAEPAAVRRGQWPCAAAPGGAGRDAGAVRRSASA